MYFHKADLYLVYLLINIGDGYLHVHLISVGFAYFVKMQILHFAS